MVIHVGYRRYWVYFSVEKRRERERDKIFFLLTFRERDK